MVTGHMTNRHEHSARERTAVLRKTVVILALWAAPVAAQDAATALRRAEAAYHRLSSLTASFSQTIENPMLGDPEQSRGTLYVVPPNRFAMRFDEPAGDRIVADGTWLWLYTPSTVTGQVLRQALPHDGVAPANLMGQFADSPLERYEAAYVGTETVAGEVTDVLRLTPRAPNVGFRAAEIAVARRDGIIRRMIVTESSVQRRVLEFRNISPDVSISPRELEFVVSEGVTIVELPER
jgi:outer membrane lipoprotein carrier protein